MRVPLLTGQPAPVAQFKVLAGRKAQAPILSPNTIALANMIAELEGLRPNWAARMNAEIVQMLSDARRMAGITQ